MSCTTITLINKHYIKRRKKIIVSDGVQVQHGVCLPKGNVAGSC